MCQKALRTATIGLAGNGKPLIGGGNGRRGGQHDGYEY
jgi:hypothetical protein